MTPGVSPYRDACDTHSVADQDDNAGHTNAGPNTDEHPVNAGPNTEEPSLVITVAAIPARHPRL